MNENARFELARKIVQTVADYEAGKLKKTARDYISGLVAAYGIMIDEPDNDAAYAQAKTDATRSSLGANAHFTITD